MAYLAQQALNAVAVSSLYALLALGYVIVHGVTDRINLAFGALFMWGGFLAVAAALALARLFYLDIPTAFVIGLPLAVAAFGATVAVLARAVVLPLAHRPGLAMLVATIGVAIVLEELARITGSSRDLWLPPILGGALLEGGEMGLRVSAMQAVLVLAALSIVAATLLALATSHAGRVWRAVADDPNMAALLGVDVRRATAVSVAAGTAITGIAGVLAVAQYGNASFHVGMIAGLKTLYVAVLGGLASPVGAVVGAVLLGAFETFWSAYLPIDYRDVASFGVLTFLLALRPSGLATRVAERV